MVKKKNPDDKVDLQSFFRAIGKKDRNWYNNLSETHKKSASPWLMMRYGSSITGDSNFMRYYVMAVNVTMNRYFGYLSKHPALQYLLLTAASPGMGTQRHTWLPPGGRKKLNKNLKLLKQLFPERKDDELELLDQINDEESIRQYMIDLGWSDKEIKNAIE